ncbi:hypothetical protein HXX76_009074 [Chlamydomonas incerta]|uniref:Uncharacterized protein n=1 Tax=Chlamydomonas incerta TaxID=51695 RepID=A0A835SUN1_CHLIN|nr:hypothetical protein HXX76_009074 [Chlamydomonas incerta]|eukprot:KAG2432151.1 hypothetical protein HXX76_009074 [Chlamydomonas incerta]
MADGEQTGARRRGHSVTAPAPVLPEIAPAEVGAAAQGLNVRLNPAFWFDGLEDDSDDLYVPPQHDGEEESGTGESESGSERQYQETLGPSVSEVGESELLALRLNAEERGEWGLERAARRTRHGAASSTTTTSARSSVVARHFALLEGEADVLEQQRRQLRALAEALAARPTAARSEAASDDAASSVHTSMVERAAAGVSRQMRVVARRQRRLQRLVEALAERAAAAPAGGMGDGPGGNRPGGSALVAPPAPRVLAVARAHSLLGLPLRALRPAAAGRGAAAAAGLTTQPAAAAGVAPRAAALPAAVAGAAARAPQPLPTPPQPRSNCSHSSQSLAAAREQGAALERARYQALHRDGLVVMPSSAPAPAPQPVPRAAPQPSRAPPPSQPTPPPPLATLPLDATLATLMQGIAASAAAAAPKHAHKPTTAFDPKYDGVGPPDGFSQTVQAWLLDNAGHEDPDHLLARDGLLLLRNLRDKAVVPASKLSAWLSTHQQNKIVDAHREAWRSSRQAAGLPTEDYSGKGSGGVQHIVLYWRDAVVRGMGIPPAAALEAVRRFRLRDADHPAEGWQQGVQRFERLLDRCPKAEQGNPAFGGRCLFYSTAHISGVWQRMQSQRDQHCSQLGQEPDAYEYKLSTVRDWLQQAWGWWEQEQAVPAADTSAKPAGRAAAVHVLAAPSTTVTIDPLRPQSSLLEQVPAAPGELVARVGEPPPGPGAAQRMYCHLHQTTSHGETSCRDWEILVRSRLDPAALATAIRSNTYAEKWRDSTRRGDGRDRGGRGGGGGNGSGRGGGPPAWQRSVNTMTAAIQVLESKVDKMDSTVAAAAQATAAANSAAAAAITTTPPPLLAAAPAVATTAVAAPTEAAMAQAAAAAAALLVSSGWRPPPPPPPPRAPAGVHVAMRPSGEEEEIHAPPVAQPQQGWPYHYPSNSYLVAAHTAVLRGPMPPGFVPAGVPARPPASGAPRPPQQPQQQLRRVTWDAALLIPLLEQLSTIRMGLSASHELLEELLAAVKPQPAVATVQAPRTSTISVVKPGFIELVIGTQRIRPKCSLPDSGSEVSLITDAMALAHGLAVEEDPKFRMHTAAGLSQPLQRVARPVEIVLYGVDGASHSWTLAECWVVPGPQLFDLLIGTGCLARFHYILDTGRQLLGLREPGAPTAPPMLEVPLQPAVTMFGQQPHQLASVSGYGPGTGRTPIPSVAASPAASHWEPEPPDSAAPAAGRAPAPLAAAARGSRWEPEPPDDAAPARSPAAGSQRHRTQPRLPLAALLRRRLPLRLPAAKSHRCPGSPNRRTPPCV